ncbi:hypothetical protein CPB86DRAFT_829521 [Serendipita vermifera]|nr:hypothetical protein CPB86DRAFT_829521 [Serendipita vermifera]
MSSRLCHLVEQAGMLVENKPRHSQDKFLRGEILSCLSFKILIEVETGSTEGLNRPNASLFLTRVINLHYSTASISLEDADREKEMESTSHKQEGSIGISSPQWLLEAVLQISLKTMLSLSNEVIQQIFLALAPIDLFHCCMTCRRFYLCATSFGQTRDLLTLGSYGYTTTNASPWTKDSLSQFLKYKKNQLLLYFNPTTLGVKQWEIERGNNIDCATISHNEGVVCRAIRSMDNGYFFTMGAIQLTQLYPLSGSLWDVSKSPGSSKDSSVSTPEVMLGKGGQLYRITDLGYDAIGLGTSIKDDLLVVVQLTDLYVIHVPFDC